MADGLRHRISHFFRAGAPHADRTSQHGRRVGPGRADRGFVQCIGLHIMALSASALPILSPGRNAMFTGYRFLQFARSNAMISSILESV
jgi:hypothetical protein